MKEKNEIVLAERTYLFVTPMISDHAVLQRDETIIIRGSGIPGKRVMAELVEEKNAGNCPYRMELEGIIESDGRWKLKFSPLQAGGPYRMRIISEDEVFDFSDIYIGDVWLLSGQSNMQLPIERVKYCFPKEYKEGASTLIRQFQVPIGWNFKEEAKELSGGKWMCASPEDVSKFSAVGFFFAQRLLEQYDIPVGLILTAVGGTPIQAWMSREALEKYPEQLQIAKMFTRDEYIRQIKESDSVRAATWWSTLNKLDRGMRNNWLLGDHKAGEWRGIDLSKPWEDYQDLCEAGSVWLRKEIEIPPNRAQKPLRISLGTVTDADFSYINGKRVGNIDYKYPPREYEISGLPAGKNVIVIRVVAVHGTGGFTRGKKHLLIWKEDEFCQDISSDWEYCRGAVMAPLQEQTFFERKPMGMYQEMIAPLHEFAIKGICWYQGEMNADDEAPYPGYFSKMVEDWRRKWRKEHLPVLFVQLPNYDLEDAGNWVNFRSMQQSLTHIPDTAMVVSIDCGEYNDLHPVNKKPVGERLAMAAFLRAYGEMGPWLSPLFSFAKIRGSELILYFENAENGLTTRENKEIKGLEICLKETGKQIVGSSIITNMESRIEGNTVVITLSWELLSELSAVRYAWSNHPVDANLCNKIGLPVAPFFYQFSL